MNPTDEMIGCLHSIDATLRELLALSKTKRATASMPAPRQPLETAATEADLDSQYGDELVKFKPRGWTGDFIKDTPMSQCPPDFLDQLALAYDWFAQQKRAADDPKAQYEERSARRARGWASRLRSGWTSPALATMATKDDITW